MSRYMKKGTGVVLASILAAGSCIPAYAAGIEPHESIAAPDGGAAVNTSRLTIDKPADGHTYEVYQIFTGSVSADGTKLSNVKYGVNYGEAGTAVPEAELEALEGIPEGTASAEHAKQFAEKVNKDKTGSPAAVLTKESPSADLEAGYYLVIDKPAESDKPIYNDAVSDFIVAVIGTKSIQPKSVSIPTFDKSIDEEAGGGTGEDILAKSTALRTGGIIPEAFASDSTGGTEGPAAQEAIEIPAEDVTVDYDKGDHIPFKLVAGMPDSISAYKKYQLIFHDKLSNGMEYDEGSVKVFAGDTEIAAEHYTVNFSTDETGRQMMSVSIADAKAAPFNAVAGTKITVKYSVTLTDAADAEAVNEAALEYSNDPKGDGTGITGNGPDEPDKVKVITFELRFDKTDKDGNALEGAGFTLYKKNDAGEYVPVGSEITGQTRFSFDGMAVGEYKLVETTTPDGYNTMEDFVFKIVAEKTTDEAGNEILKVQMVDAQNAVLNKWVPIAADKAFEADIINYSGSSLPETGGMGTYAFYAAGAVLVIAVGTVIASRKRSFTED